jgi:hypothetical protein
MVGAGVSVVDWVAALLLDQEAVTEFESVGLTLAVDVQVPEEEPLADKLAVPLAVSEGVDELLDELEGVRDDVVVAVSELVADGEELTLALVVPDDDPEPVILAVFEDVSLGVWLPVVLPELELLLDMEGETDAVALLV